MTLLSSPTWQALDSPVIRADCIEAMRCVPDCSVDAIVTDPPYGLEFMGAEWDAPWRGDGIVDADQWNQGQSNAFSRSRVRHGRAASYGTEGGATGRAFQKWSEHWATECLRILKPGGHLLAFGGTRTYHRLACAVEDAGFEIRDSLLWLFGSGFPKSHDVSKAIDKAAGVEREVIGSRDSAVGRSMRTAEAGSSFADDAYAWGREIDVTTPATPEAAQWQGWGTALKPAHEPIVVARKPLEGTVAANVLAHGTGALNIDGCRLGTDAQHKAKCESAAGNPSNVTGDVYGEYASPRGNSWTPAGRWPANVALSHLEECEPVGIREVKPANGSGKASSKSGGLSGIFGDGSEDDMSGGFGGTETIEAWNCVSGCPVAELDAQTGDRRAGAFPQTHHAFGDIYTAGGERPGKQAADRVDLDSGGASRFLYTAKTSRAERNAGLEGFNAVNDTAHRKTNLETADRPHLRGPTKRQNHHPTVKPINLMRWLVRLVTPPDGLILDPFCGSGTTGCAAALEGFDFIGIEREPEYAEIARARIAFWAKHQGREIEDVLARHSESQKAAKAHAERGQMSITEEPELALAGGLADDR